MGTKQGPAIYQHMQDHAFKDDFKPNGDKLCEVYFDDTHCADNTLEEHFVTLEHVLTNARKFNIQYRLTKREFCKPEVLLIGFICSAKGRRADPKKCKQLREWPDYKSPSDIESHLAFCNYLREILGPDYPEMIKPLRAYLRKGADWSLYADDTAAQNARKWLVSMVLEPCILHTPDWKAAAWPWHSGRPFEAYFDASDLCWCVCLVQQDTPGGRPRIITFCCKSFVDEATRWSAFERELYGFKEGYVAIVKWVQGFKLFAYIGHRNIDRAESVLASLRASKKLVHWIVDTQELIANVARIWIDGKQCFG